MRHIFYNRCNNGNQSIMQLILDDIGSGELYLKIMRAICWDANGKSMIDLGCHRAPYTPQLGFADRTYVDIQDRSFDFPEEKVNFVCNDAIRFLQETNWSWHTAIASDFSEHLLKEDGVRLIELMKQKSDKQVIFTPFGEYNLTKDDHPDSHRSGWLPEDFPGWGALVFPNFHPLLNAGAFFVFNCKNMNEEWDRVLFKLNHKDGTIN